MESLIENRIEADNEKGLYKMRRDEIRIKLETEENESMRYYESSCYVSGVYRLEELGYAIGLITFQKYYNKSGCSMTVYRNMTFFYSFDGELIDRYESNYPLVEAYRMRDLVYVMVYMSDCFVPRHDMSKIIVYYDMRRIGIFVEGPVIRGYKRVKVLGDCVIAYEPSMMMNEADYKSVLMIKGKEVNIVKHPYRVEGVISNFEFIGSDEGGDYIVYDRRIVSDKYVRLSELGISINKYSVFDCVRNRGGDICVIFKGVGRCEEMRFMRLDKEYKIRSDYRWDLTYPEKIGGSIIRSSACEFYNRKLNIKIEDEKMRGREYVILGDDDGSNEVVTFQMRNENENGGENEVYIYIDSYRFREIYEFNEIALRMKMGYPEELNEQYIELIKMMSYGCFTILTSFPFIINTDYLDPLLCTN